MLDVKLFKWVGGKKWLAPQINQILKENYSNKKYRYYIEPFAGGLGSFLHILPILKEMEVEIIVLNDVNKTLINTYKSLKNKKNKVFKEYWALEKEYFKLIPKKAFKLHPTKDKEILRPLLEDSCQYFYNARDKFNEIKDSNDIKAVALFLFLSQHSFNGLYRENLKGDYNTPYNWETGNNNKNKKKELIELYSNIFKDNNIIFENKDVFKLMSKYRKHKENSLFYFDPPYLNENIAENKYNKNHFGIEEQKRLLKEYLKIDNYIFSNHYLELFKSFCEKNNISQKEVLRSNVMTRDISKRGEKISEILAYKYC